MNIIKIVLILILFSQLSFAQITKTKINEVEVKSNLPTKPYDSTMNYLGGDVYNYIGQKLYLKEKSESSRGMGYEGFYKDTTSTSKTNIYKCCASKWDYSSNYDSLAGKYFNVIEIRKPLKATERPELYKNDYFLGLKVEGTGDTTYFEYSGTSGGTKFPFIVVGYFEKLKEYVIGQKFVFANLNLEGSKDIVTGKTITIRTNQTWECVDLTIEEINYSLSLVLKNTLGEKVTIKEEWVFNKFPDKEPFDLNYNIYSIKEAKIYEKKFKKQNWNKILEAKVEVGFTEEMVRLSWGEPGDINEASYGDQWVYGSQYLYFKNGKLKSFN